MATTSSTQLGKAPNLYTATPEKYTTIGTLLDPTKLDARDYLVKTYGDQGITGFLTLTGAVKNAGTADFVRWYEEGRRHKTYLIPSGATIDNGTTEGVVSITANGTDFNKHIQVQDVVMSAETGQVFICTASGASTGTLTFLKGNNASADNASISANTSLIIIGNMYAEGTDQPSNFYDTSLKSYDNNYMIIKEVFKVTGSQATNIGYVNVGNGDYRWYIHGENEARKRFMDKREMMMLFAEFNSGTIANAPGGVAGSEGYFSAVKKRGITVSGADASPLDTIAEFDSIIIELDKQGAPSEYAMYLNRKQSLAIDDMLASGIATQVTAGLPGQFGAFNNNPDMAVQLGFKSFTRGGYTFHKHDWKLLNDPTLLGATAQYQGAMIPMTMVADAKTGVKAPALELNYKAANGYSREIEHWVTGSILGFNNTTKDEAVFNYRSEVCLVTRAANQHVAITK
jgi:hypothetical protein